MRAHRVTLHMVGAVARQDVGKAVRLRVVLARVQVLELRILRIIEPAVEGNLYVVADNTTTSPNGSYLLAAVPSNCALLRNNHHAALTFAAMNLDVV